MSEADVEQFDRILDYAREHAGDTIKEVSHLGPDLRGARGPLLEGVRT